MAMILFGCFLAGVLTACLYLYVLWKTVLYLPKTTYKISLFLGSLMFRLFLLGGCFYLIANDSLERLISALIGFFLIRLFYLSKKKSEIRKLLEGRNA